MATTAPASPDAIFDLADQIALISSEVLRFRIRNRPSLPDADKASLEALEIRLDQVTAQLRGLGVQALGTVTQAARDEIAAATQAAEAKLRRIRQAERAIAIATSVVGLAVAVVARQPQGIFDALKGVQAATQSDA